MSIPFPQRPLFEVWQVETPGPLSWRAQLVGYVGNFESEEAAVKYVTSVKDYRERFGSGQRTLEPGKGTSRK
jgi:hypothetical protein